MAEEFVTKQVLLETLGEFTDTVLLPAVEDIMEDKLDKRFNEFEKKIDEKLDKRFDEFERKLDQKIDAKLDKRFDEFEKKLDIKLDRRFDESDEKTERRAAERHAELLDILKTRRDSERNYKDKLHQFLGDANVLSRDKLLVLGELAD